MDRTDDVFALGVIDGRVRIFLSKVLVADPLVGAEQADLVRDGFAHECGERIGADVLNDASHDIALAADSADDWRFAGANAAGPAAAAALVPMPVLGEAADESFINLDNAPIACGIFIEQARPERDGTYTKRFGRSRSPCCGKFEGRSCPSCW